MYYLQIGIRPTAGLTFRRMPSSILHISTYPFLPPSTMSGWLRRLLMLRQGLYPETKVKNPPTYVLPKPPYHVLGAYPVPSQDFRLHTTHRQGIRSFSHTAFSELVNPHRSKENYQLHTWEYLFVDHLRGYVVSEKAGPLEELQKVVNLGCKLGKEGYAYVESISEVQELTQQKKSASPSVLVSARALVGLPSRIYTLYRHEHEGGIPLEDLDKEVPNPIAGFVPFRAGWPDQAIELDYWTDGEVFIPQATLDEL